VFLEHFHCLANVFFLYVRKCIQSTVDHKTFESNHTYKKSMNTRNDMIWFQKYTI
jgi:hypothetical protein